MDVGHFNVKKVLLQFARSTTEPMPNTLMRLCFLSFDSNIRETVCKLSDWTVALLSH